MNHADEKRPDSSGVVPVTDKSPADANVSTRRYLDSLQVEMRLIDSVKPDLSVRIFGKSYRTPLLKEGREGVVKKVNEMNRQLSEMCIYTGVGSMQSFDPSVLHLAAGASL